MNTLGGLTSFARSKNAGPFMCTIDLFFDDLEKYRLVRDSGAFTAANVGELYGIPESQVKVFAIDAALALKASFPRRVQAGHPSDSDITCGQQFIPLLDLRIG